MYTNLTKRMPNNPTNLSFKKEECYQKDYANTVYYTRFNNNPEDTHLLVRSKSCFSA